MGDGNVLCYVILLSLMFVRDGVGGVGDGSSLFRHLLVRDGVGGVGMMSSFFTSNVK